MRKEDLYAVAYMQMDIMLVLYHANMPLFANHLNLILDNPYHPIKELLEYCKAHGIFAVPMPMQLPLWARINPVCQILRRKHLKRLDNDVERFGVLPPDDKLDEIFAALYSQ